MLLIAPQGSDILFSKDRIQIGRNFMNKIWNACRFLQMNISEKDIPDIDIDYKKIDFKRGIAGTLLNLAAIDNKQGNHKLSLEKHKESLKLFKEHGTKTDLTYTLNSIGNIYINLKTQIKN